MKCRAPLLGLNRSILFKTFYRNEVVAMGSGGGCCLPIQRSSKKNSCVYSSLTYTLGNEMLFVWLGLFSPIIALITPLNGLI